MSALPMSGMTDGTDEELGLPAVADRLGVHRATVNDMVRDGRLAAHRNGAHWMVLRSDLDAFAASYVRPVNAPSRRETSIPSTWPAIRALLVDFGSASPGELAPLLELHEGNVRKHLRLLEVCGRVRRASDGQWVLVDRPTSQPVDPT
ncbi:MAG TPA: helix-turn-helix domain-containing protein [Acidimicrobiales bacterium]|nr:helix-turn-helix domain-containing protein [Acidimicrobiales bacterium]